jgi:shikimate dehydrogenase
MTPRKYAGQPVQITHLTGLAGRGIAASRSPWLHEREAEAQGLSLSYELFDFDARGWNDDHLPLLIDALQAKGFAGLNVTFPFKKDVTALLDDLSDAARRIGAVNTISFEGGKRIGHNTDILGFAESLNSGLPGAALGHVVQYGAGGAGAATAHALLELGTDLLTIIDTDEARLAALAAKLGAAFDAARVAVATDGATALAGADGVVNATPVGMASFPGTPFDTKLLTARQWVADIVYFPLETQLLRDARMMGCATLDGSGMAVLQAAASFDIFTGLSAERARMRRSFVEFDAETGFGLCKDAGLDHEEKRV